MNLPSTPGVAAPTCRAHRRASASIAAAILVAAVAGCATTGRSAVATWAPSPNFDARRPQMIVLHQTEMPSAEAALAALRDPRRRDRVSAHYLVAASGRVYQLVRDGDRAWHAGASRWAGRSDLNSASIGIELDNDGVAPFTDAQIAALLTLLADVTSRWNIAHDQIVAHADVAPTRKVDPGPHFPWARLAAAGYGLWPRKDRGPAPEGFDPWLALRTIGYDLTDPRATSRAYHRRFRATDADAFDAEDLSILADLQRQVVGSGPR
jgi:N-acetylmuramoyl-L-alanine amidase